MIGRAPGRVCLLGEHCDWAGGSCLVAPLDQGVSVQVRAADWGLVIHSELGISRIGADGRAVPSDPNRYVAAVARELLRRGVALPAARAVVLSDLPMGRGFGSSAALCVAAARALAAYARAPLSEAEAADVAFAAEHEDLGVACGRMDQLASAWGTLLFIDWDKDNVEPLPRPGLEPLWLLAAALPEPRPAGELLDALVMHREREDVRGALQRWDDLAREGREALLLDDLGALGACMNAAQDAYDAIALEALAAPGIRAARASLPWALGSKFTGAGGDRSLVALFAGEADRERGRVALEDLGLQVL